MVDSTHIRSQPIKRPLGVTIWAGIFSVTGGIALLILFVEILINISYAGIHSLFIINASSLVGFLLYAAIPIVFYMNGIGLFLLRPWARPMTLFVQPFLIWTFLFNISCHIGQIRLQSPVDLLMAPAQNPNLFLSLIMAGGLIVSLLITYFIRPQIAQYF